MSLLRNIVPRGYSISDIPQNLPRGIHFTLRYAISMPARRCCFCLAAHRSMWYDNPVFISSFSGVFPNRIILGARSHQYEGDVKLTVVRRTTPTEETL